MTMGNLLKFEWFYCFVIQVASVVIFVRGVPRVMVPSF